MTNKINLIICATPLQILIAEKIIELHSEEDFFGVMLAKHKNTKFMHYYHRLQCCCSKTKFIPEVQELKSIFRGKLRKICYFWKLKKSISLPTKKFEKVFVSNIDKNSVHIMLSFIKFNTLFTFDDGSANILQNSFLYSETSINRKNIWPCKSFYSLFTLRELSQKHYTIYPGYKNIISNTEPVSLWPELKGTENITHYQPPIRIFLGQPLYESDVKKSEQLMQQIVDTLGIENYFRHPREYYELNNINYIKTKLIFEDYLFTALSENPNARYEIYTTGSSTVLHIMQFPNIKIKIIQVENFEKINPWYLDLINLYAKFNIEKIHFQPNIT